MGADSSTLEWGDIEGDSVGDSSGLKVHDEAVEGDCCSGLFSSFLLFTFSICLLTQPIFNVRVSVCVYECIKGSRRVMMQSSKGEQGAGYECNLSLISAV